MTTAEVILGIATVVLPVLTYFAGVHRAQRRYNREQSETRISRVLDAYLANARSFTTMGFHGLMKAGVGTLESDQEIRTLIMRITQHGEKTPLGKHETLLQSVDLQTFFETAQELGYDFINQGNPEDVVRRITDRQKAADPAAGPDMGSTLDT